jgi:predicted Fe-Mo cluster-binding NifX family protein
LLFFSLMRIALPVWAGRVSPVFDVAEQILVVDIVGGEAAFSENHIVRGADRAGLPAELGVEALICGAISHELEERLIASGIEVVTEIRGEVRDVIRAYADGSLTSARFSMPGSHSRRRRARRPRPTETAPASGR